MEFRPTLVLLAIHFYFNENNVGQLYVMFEPV